jgi:hypothetical protein
MVTHVPTAPYASVRHSGGSIFIHSQTCDRVDLTRHSNFKPSMLHCCDTGNYCMRANHLVFCQRGYRRQSECHLSPIIRTFRRSQQAAFLKSRRLSAFVIERTKKFHTSQGPLVRANCKLLRPFYSFNPQ